MAVLRAPADSGAGNGTTNFCGKVLSIRDKCILICEDEVLIALDIWEAVESYHGTVMGPHSRVATALAALESKTPDAAILDFNLLDGDCTPVIEKLAAAGVPMVLQSGREIPNALSRFKLETRLKPVLPEELIRAISHPIDSVATLQRKLDADA